MRPIYIFTYYDRIPTWNHTEIIGIWKRNWSRAGCNPIVLNRSIAKKHKKFGEFLLKVRKFPTINDPAYEEACYIRWLAFAVMLEMDPNMRAIMADYDVFNNGFGREHMGGPEIVLHELTRVPCMVEATKAGAEKIIDFIMSRQPDHSTGHYSDMYAFKESDWPITGHCLELGEVRGNRSWKEAPAIHAASGAIHREAPGQDKTDFIRKTFH